MPKGDATSGRESGGHSGFVSATGHVRDGGASTVLDRLGKETLGISRNRSRAGRLCRPDISSHQPAVLDALTITLAYKKGRPNPRLTECRLTFNQMMVRIQLPTHRAPR